MRQFTWKDGDRYVDDLGKKKVEDELSALSSRVNDCKVIDFEVASLSEDTDSDAYDTDLEESFTGMSVWYNSLPFNWFQWHRFYQNFAF